MGGILFIIIVIIVVLVVIFYIRKKQLFEGDFRYCMHVITCLIVHFIVKFKQNQVILAIATRNTYQLAIIYPS